MSRRLGILGISAILVLMASCGGGHGTGFQFNGTGSNTGTSAQHVVIVVFENQNYSDVVGSSSMPYWNSLASSASLATKFYADVHPSLGNYLWMTAGQDPTLGSSNPDAFSGTVSGDNVASVLTAAGKTWRAYAQSIPSAGYTGGDQYPYVKHHNPFVYFDSVLNSSSQTANVVNLSQFSSDVGAGTLPNYSFVIPDDEHNGHDCPTGGSACLDSDKLTAADNWLKNNIDPLIKSPALANSVFIIVFDESLDVDLVNGGGKVAWVMTGAHVKAGFKSTTFYQHQSTLRLVLDLLRVADHPGNSATAATMGEFFQ